MDYVITFSDVMAGVITLGLGVITFFIKGWFNNLKSSTEEIKKQIKENDDKVKENYDRISVMLPKGTKDRIQAQGLTINGFVNQLVLDKLDELEKNNNECPF